MISKSAYQNVLSMYACVLVKNSRNLFTFVEPDKHFYFQYIHSNQDRIHAKGSTNT